MRYIEVLIDLPMQYNDTVFTYHLQPGMEAQVEFGRRVLVPLGRRRAEGLVVNDNAEAWPDTQPLLKVLDETPVISSEALALARWMAEYYCCSLYTALKAMIPRRLNKKTGPVVIPLAAAGEINGPGDLADPDLTDFMIQLQERGEIPCKEARTVLGGDRLANLESQGYVIISGSYSGYRSKKTGGEYTIGEFDPELDGMILKSRAPRQAEAMELVMARDRVDKSWLEQRVPIASIKSLLEKNFLKLEDRTTCVSSPLHTLSPDQSRVLQEVESALDRKAMAEYLVYGITGSGKTEIYIRSVQSVLQRGRSALVLIPEIALTRHLVEIFSERIPDLAVIHSRMTTGERYEEWKRIRSGEVKLVLGTRSAVFAPIPNLGLIIIDEEQEHSYKQQEQPRYHAREVARQLAIQRSAVLIMGSATPSFESFNEAVNDRNKLLKMPERAGGASLPAVFIADMRKGKSGILSDILREKILQMIQRGEQTILFQNRRGHSPLTICLDCGHIPGCPHCSVALTYHRDPDMEICHYCSYHTRVLSTCPVCGSNKLQRMGTGTQKVETEVREIFPQARVARLDLDSSQRKDAQPRILAGMKNGDIDILIGTQMVARGLDFPGVSLVGILDVDNMLNLPDFRAAERCFQLIVQAAGRAGRRDKLGEVVIQTYNPEHPVVEMASRQDYEGFFYNEIEQRRLLNYPPFTHLLRIVVVGEGEDSVRRSAMAIGQEINELGDAKEEDFVILGPAPCPIYFIKNRFRYQLMVKCDNILLLSSLGRAILTQGRRPGIKVQVEIDPLASM